MSRWSPRVLILGAVLAGCGARKGDPCAEGFARGEGGHCEPLARPEGGDLDSGADSGQPELNPSATHPGWSFGEVQACGNPVPLSFTDASDLLGSGEAWSTPHEVPYGPAALVQDAGGGWAAVWQQPGGIRWNRLDGSRSGEIDTAFNDRFIPFDINNDGEMDLVYFGLSIAVVWSFLEDTAVEEVLFNSGTEGEVCGWIELILGDFSGNGLADILVPTGFGCSPPLYPQVAVQTAPGVFSEPVTSALDNIGATLDTEVMDLDGDGDLDAYLCNDFGPENGPNQWLINDGSGIFTVGDALGSGVTTYCMSAAAADLNRDGRLDLFVAGIGDQFALVRDDQGFVDHWNAWALPTLLSADQMPWGVAATDLDNNGLVDLVLSSSTFSHLIDVDGEPTYAHLQTGPGVFEERSAALGLPRSANTRGVVARDVNEDGVLDLLIADYRRSPWLLLSDGCTAASWLAIEAPLGTVVEVTAGGQVIAGLVTHHQGYAGFGPIEHHMGLGEAREVERVVAHVPGAGTVEIAEPFEVPRRIRWAPQED